MAEYVDNATVRLAFPPLRVFPEDPAIEIFCTGLVMDVVTDLSRFRSFRILSDDPAPGQGRPDRSEEDRHLDYVVRGLAHYHGERLQITLQLHSLQENRLVWGEKFGGPLQELFRIQKEIVEKIVTSLQSSVDHDLLAEIRRKPITRLNAYECWLRGMQEVRKGTLEADEQARKYFRQALEIDPHYARAHTGMSLTYFNEWSCQIWDRWEVSRKGAFEWGAKALELDGHDPVSAVIVGKIHLFNGEYDRAEHLLRRALRLNPNDVDTLLQVATAFTYLGYVREAAEICERAGRLGSAEDQGYLACATFVNVELGNFHEAVSLAGRLPRNTGWVDFPAYVAAAHYRIGDLDRMWSRWNDFLEDFSEKINGGESADPQVALAWMIDVNPYRGSTELQPFWDFMGDGQIRPPLPDPSAAPSPGREGTFREEGGVWTIVFESVRAQLRDLKGLHDIARLLAVPGEEIHVTELMGAGLVEEGIGVFDEKARNSYRRRVLELQEELKEAEELHDRERTLRLQSEYEELLDTLSASVGKGGRTRTVSGTVQKARSAVTWRIRKAIREIRELHPELGRHLDHSIKTGVFCRYSPESRVDWSL